jgi:hypothetical protein
VVAFILGVLGVGVLLLDGDGLVGVCGVVFVSSVVFCCS